MKAIVGKVNYRRGWIAYETTEVDWGWFEVLDSVDFEEGDEIWGNFTTLGEITIEKGNTGEKVSVFMEDYGMSKKKAIEMIMR